MRSSKFHVHELPPAVLNLPISLALTLSFIITITFGFFLFLFPLLGLDLGFVNFITVFKSKENMEGDSSSSSSSPVAVAAAAGAGGELFQEWELLQNTDSDVVNSENPVESQRSFEEIEGDYSEGMIRADYFSIDNEKRHVKTSLVVSEEGSVESDNPSWIDPGSETQYQRKNSGGFWSDSGSDRSDERKYGAFDGRNELGFVENLKNGVGFEGIGERGIGADNLMKFGDFDLRNELGFDESTKGQVDFKGIGVVQDQNKDLGSRFWSDSGGDGLVSMSFEGVGKESEVSFGDHVDKQDESEACVEFEGGNGSMEENSNVAIEESRAGERSAGDGERKRVAWWKVPFEVLKYCVLKVNPVWSFSMAAAVMGLVILGRRLYKMKQKSRNLQLKVTLDDKVSYCICFAITIGNI